MCFSVEASFIAAAALVPVGVYCLSSALRKDVRFVPLALTPIAFAVQQAAEGFVWYGLRHDHRLMVERAAAIFLFFAVAFWPFWVPFSLLFVERRAWVKRALGLTAVASLAWLAFYAHAVLVPGRELHAHAVRHSIDYGIADLHGFRDVPAIVWRLAYLAYICGPLLLTRKGNSEFRWHIYGVVIAGLFVVSETVYWYAFASVWCFFAAVASLLLAVAFSELPSRHNAGPTVIRPPIA